MKRNHILIILILAVLTSMAAVHSDGTACPASGRDSSLVAGQPSDEVVQLYKQGRQLFQDGKYDEAIAAYKKCIQMDPSFDYAYGSLAYLYYELKKYSEAVPLYKKAIELNPSDSFYYSELGMTYVKMGQHDNAVEVLQKAVEYSPLEGEYYINLALVYFQDKNNPAEALNVLNRGLAKVNDPGKKKKIENLIKKIEEKKGR
ncbi:MAG: tetratricopeptide repeat protein [Candidatus Xenobiia bacterium LiM19]